MGNRPQEIGWSVESKLLHYIGKQLDRLAGLLKAVSGTIPTMLSQLTADSTHRTVTDAEKSTWNAKQSVYKNVYTAFISQASTNAPTEDIVLKDDLAVPVWSYDAVGTFLLTKASAFTSTKTVPNAVVAYFDNAGNKITLERTSANVMTLKTYAAADTAVLANGVITGQYINIDVYI
jgi:hypothetical protein